MVDAVHVVDALPEMSFCMSMGIPADLGTANAYRQQFALMLQHTTKPIVFVCDDRADCEAIAAMAAAAAGGMEPLRLNPTLLLYSEPSTPLKHSETATGKLLYMAEQALPIVHSPAPMMGGTAPVTMAAGLALGNAEVLSSSGHAPAQAGRRALCLRQRPAPHGHEDHHQRLWCARIPASARRRGRDGPLLWPAYLGLCRAL